MSGGEVGVYCYIRCYLVFGKMVFCGVFLERGGRNFWNWGLNIECEMCSIDFGEEE